MSEKSRWLKMSLERVLERLFLSKLDFISVGSRTPPELAEEPDSQAQPRSVPCPVCGDPSSIGYIADEAGEVVLNTPSYPAEDFVYNLGVIYSRETLHQLRAPCDAHQPSSPPRVA